MKSLYQFFICLYPFIAKLIAPYNIKAAEWIKGRLTVWEGLTQFANASTQPIIWMHCSSLGEFEQGLPVAEQLKSTFIHYRLLITFFSPSGYLVRKNHPIANFVCYLPMDGAKNAALFLQLVQPKLAIFIKYEFWLYYLQGLKKRDIPTILVSGIFREEQVFFKWYGNFYRNMLTCFSQLLVQDDHSRDLLSKIGLATATMVSGDTRFDRVISIAQQPDSFALITQFCQNERIIVAGSTWSEDDKALHHLALTHREIKFIVAPHNIDQSRLNECLTYYPNAMLYSKYERDFIENKPFKNVQTLIIDNMGMLSKLYQFAEIAFIGGGFSEDGIHNTLEAAVYGVPVVFGPVYEKYLEAVELINIGGAFSALDVIELEQIINQLLNDAAMRIHCGSLAQKYIQQKAGATQKVIDYIQENRLLTNE